jgi:hypothetical protein
VGEFFHLKKSERRYLWGRGVFADDKKAPLPTKYACCVYWICNALSDLGDLKVRGDPVWPYADYIDSGIAQTLDLSHNVSV